MEEPQEQIIMTPKCKTTTSTTLIVERKQVQSTSDQMHVAGGEHTGIIINKESGKVIDASAPPHLSLQFNVFLVNAQTKKSTQESRTLRFWFKNAEEIEQQATVAQDFFRDLVTPQEFPRDYVGFIKKIMKLMQHVYKTIRKLEIELRQLVDATPHIITRPQSPDEYHPTAGHVPLLSIEKVLELIESSYPNPITVQDIAKNNGWDEEEVAHHLSELQSRHLVKAMEHGAFTRQQSEDTSVIVVKQMPTMASAKQPTIAIITAQYCEKLAVDAMIENKETFVRYTTVGPSTPSSPTGESKGKSRFGESNVYTLGNIGAHRIVCTKLPTIGHTREAMTAAGNTTTRLLGTFQKVDYVFLVGVGGGVPHFTDYNKHVRLGDVVVSCPTNNNKYIYTYCEGAKRDENGAFNFETKTYATINKNLQDIAVKLKASGEAQSPWLAYLRNGLNHLKNTSENDFAPPSSETDKLYMTIGERDLIEVAHPEPQDNKSTRRQEGCPRIHLSPVASGRQVVKDDRTRQQFATQYGACAFDCEFDAVIESVLGNCKDSFIIIRGISDYKDGTRRKEWQPYASLVAASVMKSIICCMAPPTNV